MLQLFLCIVSVTILLMYCQCYGFKYCQFYDSFFNALIFFGLPDWLQIHCPEEKDLKYTGQTHRAINIHFAHVNMSIRFGNTGCHASGQPDSHGAAPSSYPGPKESSRSQPTRLCSHAGWSINGYLRKLWQTMVTRMLC